MDKGHNAKWPQEELTFPLNRSITLEPFLTGKNSDGREVFNEEATIKFLGDFYTFLCWYSGHRKNSNKEDKNASTQILCYVDKLLEVFNSTDVNTRLQATKLLLKDKLKVIGTVMELSLKDLDTAETSSSSKR